MPKMFQTVIDTVNIPTPAHAPNHISGGSDEIDGDQLDIDFTPACYTPDTTPAEATNADHLTAHLAGIDNALVFGKNHAFAQSLPISTTTSTTFQNKVTLASYSVVAAATYRLTVSYGWNHDSGTNDFEARLMQNGAQVGELHKQEPKDAAGGDPTGTTQRYYASRTIYISLPLATTLTWDLEYRTDSGGAESSIWEATIEVWRVS